MPSSLMAYGPATRVRDEVHAPALIRPDGRVEVQAVRSSDPLADAPAHGEPLRSVEAVDELVVDGPALALEQAVQHPIAVARPFAGELAEVLAQLRVLG